MRKAMSAGVHGEGRDGGCLRAAVWGGDALRSGRAPAVMAGHGHGAVGWMDPKDRTGAREGRSGGGNIVELASVGCF